MHLPLKVFFAGVLTHRQIELLAKKGLLSAKPKVQECCTRYNIAGQVIVLIGHTVPVLAFRVAIKHVYHAASYPVLKRQLLLALFLIWTLSHQGISLDKLAPTFSTLRDSYCGQLCIMVELLRETPRFYLVLSFCPAYYRSFVMIVPGFNTDSLGSAAVLPTMYFCGN